MDLADATEVQRDDPAPRSNDRWALGRWSAAWLAAPVALVIIAMAMALISIHEHPRQSPIDELSHLDYTYQVAHGHLVRRGDDVGTYALSVQACRLIDLPGWTGEPCTGPNGTYTTGANISYMHPPLYYGVTGGTARVLTAVGVPSFATAARIANSLWFAAGIVLLYLLLGELGVAGITRFCGALLPALAPIVLYQAGTVTNDVTAVPTAAAVLLVTLRVERGAARSWLLVVAALVAIWSRMTNGFGVAVAIVYLATRAIQATDRERRRRLVRIGGALVGATAGAVVLWLVMLSVMARVDSIPFAALVPKHFEFDQFLTSIPAMVPPTQNVPPVPFWSNKANVNLVVAAIGWAVVAGPLIAMARPQLSADVVPDTDTAVDADADGSRLAPLGLAAGLVLVLMAPMLVIVNTVSDDSLLYMPFPTRVGLSVLPGCFAAFLAGTRSRWAGRALAVLVAAGLSVMLVTIA